jgi:hypothetical protein
VTPVELAGSAGVTASGPVRQDAERPPTP